MTLLILLLAYLVFAVIAICMFFNWISTGDPNGAVNGAVSGDAPPNSPPPDVERARAYRPDVIRVERGDWSCAGGDVVCSVCGCVYYDHSSVIGYTWLRRTCTGKLVKL